MHKIKRKTFSVYLSTPENDFLANQAKNIEIGTMPKVNFKRKEVSEHETGWTLISDCIAGEETIKKGKELYLPRPTADEGTDYGRARYKAYVLRAVFYNVTGRTLEGLVGQVFSKDSKVELVSDLERYALDIDGSGTSLEQQAKATLGLTVGLGHCGLLSDYPGTKGIVTKEDIDTLRIRPRVILIKPQDIINWRVTVVGGETLLSLVVLQESAVIGDDAFELKTEPRWREIRLVEVTDESERTNFVVVVTVWRKKDKPENGEDFEVIDGYPVILRDYKEEPLDRIPFEFVGATNNEPQIDKAPLIDLATLNVAHYRNSADYEEGLFITGQDQLVMTGLTQEWKDANFADGVKLGSRNSIPLPKDATAFLLHADPNSIAAEAMKHKEDQMKSLGAKLIEPTSSKGTATEALIEEASESSTLSSAAKNVSAAYRKALYNASRFVAEVDPKSIVFELNSDFSASRASAEERAQTLKEWQAGLITDTEARTQLRKQGIATEEDEAALRKIADTIIPVEPM